MAKFDEKHLPDLDVVVLNTLDLFAKGIPKLHLGSYKRPLVVGSGNAAATGKILFQDRDAIFADESTYKEKLKTIKGIDGAILISASGSKHSPIIAKELKRRKIDTRHITNTANNPTSKIVPKNKVFVLPKLPEPYTYNTSTYMSSIIAHTKENPKSIKQFILKNVLPKIPKNLKQYKAYYFIIPPEFDNLREMLLTKFDELFGPEISGRIFTLDQSKHAKTVVQSDKELFVNFGTPNPYYGTKKLAIPLPKGADYAAVMAITYFFIGHIQKQNPDYFKKGIAPYLKQASKIFKTKLDVIVE